jgi:hypothetical protein
MRLLLLSILASQLIGLHLLSNIHAMEQQNVANRKLSGKKLCFDNAASDRSQHIFLPSPKEVVNQKKKMRWFTKKHFEATQQLKKNQAEIEQLKNQLKKGGVLIEGIAARHHAIKLHPSRNGLSIPSSAAKINIKTLREQVKDFQLSKPITLRQLKNHRSIDKFWRKQKKQIEQKIVSEKIHMQTLEKTIKLLQEIGISHETR